MTIGNAEDTYGRKALHIVIAEDQPTIQELLCWTLQLAGYRTTVMLVDKPPSPE